jgi:hypothetical protein
MKLILEKLFPFDKKISMENNSIGNEYGNCDINSNNLNSNNNSKINDIDYFSESSFVNQNLLEENFDYLDKLFILEQNKHNKSFSGFIYDIDDIEENELNDFFYSMGEMTYGMYFYI